MKRLRAVISVYGNTQHGNLKQYVEVLITTSMRFGTISAVRKPIFIFVTSFSSFFF